jgi:hypothetical protein
MALFSHTLATVPELLALAALGGRMLAPLIREARLTFVAWLALRGTQPSERPEIIRAFTTERGNRPAPRRQRRHSPQVAGAGSPPGAWRD